MRYLLFLSLMLLTAQCTSEIDLPALNEKQLQSYELHYDFGQIDYDSLFYTNGTLTEQVYRLGGGDFFHRYEFEYSGLSVNSFLNTNGVPSVDFVKQATFDAQGKLLQTIVQKEDGTRFATYDLVYDNSEILVAQNVTGQNLVVHIDSIEVDARGNWLSIKTVGTGSSVVYQYDENPNPFYSTLINDVDFRGEWPNNVTEYQVYLSDTLFFTKTYHYQYDADGYPTIVTVNGAMAPGSTVPDDPEKTFYFYYKE